MKLSHDETNACMNTIKRAKRAESCLSYLDEVIDAYKNELFASFAEVDVENEDDVKELLILKHHFDGVNNLRDIVQSHINSGKIAEAKLEGK
jgi:hypothetical protein